MVKRIRLKVSQLEEGGNRKGKKRRGVRESIVPVDLSSEGHLQSCHCRTLEPPLCYHSNWRTSWMLSALWRRLQEMTLDQRKSLLHHCLMRGWAGDLGMREAGWGAWGRGKGGGPGDKGRVGGLGTREGWGAWDEGSWAGGLGMRLVPHRCSNSSLTDSVFSSTCSCLAKQCSCSNM